MSGDVAISIQNLSKVYTIAHNSAKHSTLYEALIHRLRHPFEQPEQEHFKALRDVSLEIKKGSVTGIIGRNGAGKSTLLKILSRITEPSEGKVELYGRIGSLLEVGTGFHPELTGRENIYLNGQILGMRRKEIERQFDAIVDFAEVEKFLDTPVKRYSSGMYVRLAFAVAAYLDSEILLVDEVLAVGDVEFQKKCLGKMSEVSHSGRTVLFVSHNLSAISTLCGEAMLLQKGGLVFYGNASECINIYSRVSPSMSAAVWEREPSVPTGPLVIQAITAGLKGMQPNHALDINLRIDSLASHKPAFLAFDIQNSLGVSLMQAIPTLERLITDDTRSHDIGVEIDLPPLIPGRYLITVWVGSHYNDTFDLAEEKVSIEIEQSPTAGRAFPHHSSHGYIVPNSRITALEHEPVA